MTFKRERATMKTLAIAAAAAILGLASAETKFGEFSVSKSKSLEFGGDIFTPISPKLLRPLEEHDPSQNTNPIRISRSAEYES